MLTRPHHVILVANTANLYIKDMIFIQKSIINYQEELLIDLCQISGAIIIYYRSTMISQGVTKILFNLQ